MCPHLQLNLILVGLYGGIRGAHGHESEYKVVSFGYSREFVDLSEIHIFRDDVDVFLLHELLDFLLLLVFTARRLIIITLLLLLLSVCAFGYASADCRVARKFAN